MFQDLFKRAFSPLFGNLASSFKSFFIVTVLGNRFVGCKKNLSALAAGSKGT